MRKNVCQKVPIPTSSHLFLNILAVGVEKLRNISTSWHYNLWKEECGRFQEFVETDDFGRSQKFNSQVRVIRDKIKHLGHSSSELNSVFV